MHAIFKGCGHLRVAISFKVYLALHKFHGDNDALALVIVENVLRAFTK